jgi:hypothetical protein
VKGIATNTTKVSSTLKSMQVPAVNQALKEPEEDATCPDMLPGDELAIAQDEDLDAAQ